MQKKQQAIGNSSYVIYVENGEGNNYWYNMRNRKCRKGRK